MHRYHDIICLKLCLKYCLLHTLDIGFGDTYGLDKAMPVGCICIGPVFVDGAEADAPNFNCSKLLEESTLKFGTAPDNKTIEINYLNR